MKLRQKKTLIISLFAVLLLVYTLGCGQSEAAKNADALIAAIGTVDRESEAAIVAAEKAVSLLEQKEINSLKNFETLTQAQNAYQEILNQEKIEFVENAINAIGTVDTQSGEAIAAARNAFDSLDDDLKSRISNYKMMEDAENTYLKALAEKVETAIDSIGEVKLINGEERINAAQDIYDAAPAEVKALVSNYDKIQAARDQLTKLHVEDIENTIRAIGAVTLTSERLIDNAQKAYDSAAPEIQKMVSNYDEIQSARDQLTTLRVQQLNDAISAISTVTLNSGTDIDAAQRLFDAAPAEVRSQIENAEGIIADAKEQLLNLQAAEVDSLISAIGTVKLNSKDAIETARAAYTALSKEAASRVTKLQDLKNAEETLQELTTKEAARLLTTLRSDIDDVRGLAFYESKTQPYYADTRSFVLPYIGINTAKKEVWLCAHLHYTGDNWIFFESIIFAIDDKRYTKFYSRSDLVRDNAYGNVWEYVNTGDGSAYMDIFKEIADSNKTIVRFQGDVYNYDLTVSQKGKDAIKEILNVYEYLIAAGYKPID